MPHRYDYRVLDLTGANAPQIHEALTSAARDGYRLVPMAFAGQQVAIFERPHEDDEFASMTEEEKQRWFAENVEYNRVNPEWQGSD